LLTPTNKKHWRKYNNNPIERDSGEVKGRCEVMKGFKNRDSAQTTLDMHDIHQNYIHPIRFKGEKKGRTPAERAGIKIDLGRKHWLLHLIMFFPILKGSLIRKIFSKIYLTKQYIAS
jgi:hypothetical protein